MKHMSHNKEDGHLQNTSLWCQESWAKSAIVMKMDQIQVAMLPL